MYFYKTDKMQSLYKVVRKVVCSISSGLNGYSYRTIHVMILRIEWQPNTPCKVCIMAFEQTACPTFGLMWSALSGTSEKKARQLTKILPPKQTLLLFV
jgi:hypothetical protein